MKAILFIFNMLIYTCAIILTSNELFAQNDSVFRKQKVDELISKYNKTTLPGVTIVIVKDGRIILKSDYGMANLEQVSPITSSTVFLIGSVSKQFTGYSILLLNEQGKLKLNDDIRIYLPELPDFMSKITIRQLLNHTSGLRDVESLFALCGISTADTYSNENVMELVKHQKELNFNPGDEIVYSNTGFILAAEIVQRVTGKSFRDWTNENVFKPLGMMNTQFNDDNTRVIKNIASSYWKPDSTQLVKGIYNSSIVGSTGIFTTTDDMAKWIIHLGEPQIDDQGAINRLLADTSYTNKGELIDYSYGIAVTKHKGLRVNFHSGSDAGYRAFDAYFPEQKFGVAVMSNSYSISAEDFGFQIAEIYLGDKMVVKNASESTSNERNASSAEVPKKYALTKDERIKFTGKYFSDELETQYTIAFHNDTLVMNHIRNGKTVLIQVGDDQFKAQLPMMSIKMQFIRDKRNGVVGFRTSTGRARNVLFQKRITESE